MTCDDKQPVYEYEICYCNAATGKVLFDSIVGVDDSHAFEEATYECDGEIISVKRGKFLYYNE